MMLFEIITQRIGEHAADCILAQLSKTPFTLEYVKKVEQTIRDITLTSDFILKTVKETLTYGQFDGSKFVDYLRNMHPDCADAFHVNDKTTAPKGDDYEGEHSK